MAVATLAEIAREEIVAAVFQVASLGASERSHTRTCFSITIAPPEKPVPVG